MIGVEVLAGVAVTYLVRKLRPVGARLDAEVDRAVDAGLDALHELVSDTLRDDPGLAILETQAPTGGESERTVRRVTDAIAEAAENDPGFARRLQRVIQDLQRNEQPSERAVTASGAGAIAVGGEQRGIASTGDSAINIQQL